MLRNDIMNSIALKKRFCRDCSLPISLYDNPYFYERLGALDLVYDCIDKFNTFCSELTEFETEQEYFEYYNSIKNKVIDFIKSTKYYNDFINSDFKCEYIKSKKDLYIEPNDGGHFISIDMKEANFSSLRYFDERIVDYCEDWKELISRYTHKLHIINSKYIRQVIFGACNPKKQIQYEHSLTNLLCKHIMDNITPISVYSMSEDEIIIYVPDIHKNDNTFSLKSLKKVINECPGEIGKLYKIKMFVLDKIKGTEGWVKHYYDKSIPDFKCLNSEIAHQVIKYYFCDEITDNDLVFFHNGKLAKYLECIENPFK